MLTEAVVARPDPRLRQWVDRYLGYREDVSVPLARREVAGAFVVLILGWGDPMDVADPRDPARGAYGTNAFLAGPFDGWCVTRTVGTGTGVQVLLTAPAARRLLGLPLADLANRAAPVDAVAGWLVRLRDELAAARDWPRALRPARRRPGRAAGGDRRRWTRTCWRPGGGWTAARTAVGVATLAEELGWSRRHLSVRFRREFGLPPRTVARLLRFDRAYASLGRTVLTAPSAVTDETGWAERAARWGYYDQSHLIREFREFAGVTPAALAGPGSHSSNPA